MSDEAQTTVVKRKPGRPRKQTSRVTVNLPDTTIDRMDKRRGDTSRREYIARLIEEQP